MRLSIDINCAYQFPTVAQAIGGMKKAEGQTKNFFVFDTFTQRILWKWLIQEEIEGIGRNEVSMSTVKRDKHGKIVRRSYSDDVRKLIYLHADGRCEL